MYSSESGLQKFRYIFYCLGQFLRPILNQYKYLAFALDGKLEDEVMERLKLTLERKLKIYNEKVASKPLDSVQNKGISHSNRK